MSMNNEKLPDSDIWFVRAELRNRLAGYFLGNGVVVMGWAIGPVGSVESQNEIADRLRDYWTDERTGTLTKWAGEIRKFNQDMEVGDAVATYEPRGRNYHIGIIRALLVDAEPSLLEEGMDYVHRVEWLYQVAKDTLSQDYRRRNLDRRSTLHRLSPEASAALRHRCSV